MSRASEPLECAADKTPCVRILNVPGFTKSVSSWSPTSMPTSASGWSHFGHSHAAGASSHAHDAGGGSASTGAADDPD
jgi:hypothetical protein